ncbi:acyl transferase domain-containing protein [Streptomyces sp. SLBN-118]|uniref:type I polyketide synthase n=1 Tax=Streptomyces sp. SLBN-118 TaxID=2768454 RepID=UPI00114ED843|nr:type I polyketide synthase [Streptomyces sp. SLBN-118]TQK51704.1 acyl transferase domain-containing protein [Streptomyces sp. SLBN-118]
MLSSEESPEQIPDAVLGLSPFGRPDARLVGAVCRAGGLGILDLGDGDRHAREELAMLARWEPQRFGVRVGERCTLSPDHLDAMGSARPHTVLLGVDSAWQASELSSYYWVLAEVTSRAEALRALADGVDGLVARGSESGGRVGDLSTFVLLQQLTADPAVPLPVWACGGIGPHTAAAAVMGGATGVVLDTQLALLDESALPEHHRSTLAAMDGTETVVVGGRRLLRRHDAAAAREVGEPSAADTGKAQDPEGLPAGEDGFLAAGFARRWRTAAQAVRGIRTAMAQTVTTCGREDAAPHGRESVTSQDQATATAHSREPVPAHGSRAAEHVRDALTPAASAMAQALGTELPVAQGPMTRVSDQPRFAAAVAAEGGLPFLALALADGARTRTLLAETRAELGERPWGVGILGFADERIRAEQLAAVKEFRPSHAVVAGGRPGQAQELEAAGIRTFLHVPSAGLLRQFLDAGARRFVFEGSECGGHVGPLASFPLWEAQLSVIGEYLDRHADADGPGIEVLFAGGIHDARSAAMAAALAAPFADRGVAAGVLMGTAYLFTREAVELGAVQPLFQEQVTQAETTTLLHTAPGHATRCVPSPFTAEFAAQLERLGEAGTPREQIWAELEQLNLGRLRIAAKGLEHHDGVLRQVDGARQRADGMFMAGQVSVLRSSTTTIAALHHEVGVASGEFLRNRAAQLRHRFTTDRPAPGRVPPPIDVAVVGMACMFPQADGLDAYWARILTGADCVTEVDPERWDPAVHHGTGHGRTPSKWGGFLPRIPFDPLAYGIPPASLKSIEPVQLLALEAARRALDDAGYAAHASDDAGPAARAFDRTRASVVFGAEAGSDLAQATTLRTVLPAYVDQVPNVLAGQLPELTEDSFPGMLANVIAGRIANRLDLSGANYTVDAACASSLAAVDVACKELAQGTSDLVLCGGADLHNGINDYLMFASVGALSPTGRCRTFDADADGITLGEGVACVVLKRLADAERDGDRIYAVIKGIGSASDGRSLGLTAPRPEGQRAALERAYAQARVSPAQIGLVEAHGTGTVVGDRTELAVLTAVFTEAGAAAGRCALGSVKSQIGHTKCAAGLAGLIKTALALHTGVLPPTRQLARPNPVWHPESSPFVFHTAARPWAAEPADRLAAVSAFGFGGTNFHVVLGARRHGAPPAHGHAQWPAELFTFRGRDHEAAAREVRRLLDLVERRPHPVRLRDLAATVAHRAESRTAPVRIAVVAPDLESLPGLLRRAVAGEQDPASRIFLADGADSVTAGSASPGKTAFLFPGQGSQHPGMAADLLIAFPEAQWRLQLGAAYAPVLHPPAAFGTDVDERQRADLTDTRHAQPALGIAGLTAFDLLTRAGVRPDMAAGHSYGELVALCAAGALTADDLISLSRLRAEAILAAAGEDPGTMAAVAADAERTLEALRTAELADQVVLANLNAPGQTVVSGPTDAVREAVAVLRSAGLGAKRLPVACAFHSPLVADAVPAFRAHLTEVALQQPEFTVWGNATAAPYPASPDAIRDGLAQQLAVPVRFAEQIEAMYADGARIFVEAGPGSVLTGLVDRILGDRPHLAVPVEPRPDAGLPGFLTCLARLAVAGVPVHTGRLFHGRHTVDLDSAEPGRSPAWTVDGHLVRGASGEPLPGGLHPARRVALETAVSGPHVDRDALITTFLTGARELVAAQRDVLLAHFGAAPATPAPLPYVDATVNPAAEEQPRPHDEAHTIEQPPPVEPAHEDTTAVGDNLLAHVLRIISDRTGYPEDMLEPGLDLEADLSIDSIKRAEIAGELVSRLAGERLADAEIEELTRARTAGAITEWLQQRSAAEPVATPAPLLARSGQVAPPAHHPPAPGDHIPGSGGDQPTDVAGPFAPQPPHGTGPSVTPPTEPAPATAREPADEPWVDEARAAEAPPGTAPRRYVVSAAPVETERVDVDLTGKRFAVLGGGDAAASLAGELVREGGEAVVLEEPGALAAAAAHLDGVFHLGALDDDSEAVLPGGFKAFKAALSGRPAWLIGVCLADRTAGAGLAGFFRSAAREHPGATIRLIRLSERPPAAELARILTSELATRDAEPVIDLTPEGRFAPRSHPAPLGRRSRAGAPWLDRDSVVVLAGGARGITARFALALAAATRCRIELIGRTPLADTPESPVTAAAPGRKALRAALAASGDMTAAEVDRTAGLILAQREVAMTLDELDALGTLARYHTADLRDADAVDRTLKEVMAEYGRIDLVVGAAGVIEDRLIVDKDPDSFRRVYATKADSARHLLDAAAVLAERPLRAILFGSIAAVLGNRGQSDYAAANDALETLGADWAARTGNHALTVHWGPWAPTGAHTGMVTSELGRSYARRGIRLIDPEEGVRALLRELGRTEPEPTAVVLTATGW